MTIAIIKTVFLLLSLLVSGIFVEDIIENIIRYNKMDKDYFNAQHTAGLVKIFDVKLFITTILLWSIYYIQTQL